jgi:hypothetical protein
MATLHAFKARMSSIPNGFTSLRPPEYCRVHNLHIRLMGLCQVGPRGGSQMEATACRWPGYAEPRLSPTVAA